MLGINKYALYGIIVVSVTLLLITILIVSAVRYSIKQKYNSINYYMSNTNSYDNTISYEDGVKQYNKKIEKTGITSKKNRKKLLKILETLHN